MCIFLYDRPLYEASVIKIFGFLADFDSLCKENVHQLLKIIHEIFLEKKGVYINSVQANNMSKLDFLPSNQSWGKKKLKFFSVKRKQVLIFCVISGLLASSFSSLFIKIGNKVSINGEYEWKTSNGQKYVMISADDYYSQGYLTGVALGPQILKMKGILQGFCLLYHQSYSTLIQLAKKYVPYIPQRYQNEMKGMAVGSSYRLGAKINYSDILLQNTWMDIFYGRILPMSKAVIGCTGIGGMRLDNTTLIGQNFDFTEIFKFTGAFVYLNSSHSTSIFGFRLGGSLCLPIAKSSLNITVISTLVQLSVQSSIKIPIMVHIRQVLEKATDVSSFSEIYFSEPAAFTIGHTLMWADSNSMSRAEILNDSVFYPVTSSFVITNCYTNETWKTSMIDPAYSKYRQSYATNLTLETQFAFNATSKKMISVLGDFPIIARDESGWLGTSTMAYLTTQHFGFGFPQQQTAGIIPF